jgi:hypothetical protein
MMVLLVELIEKLGMMKEIMNDPNSEEQKMTQHDMNSKEVNIT